VFAICAGPNATIRPIGSPAQAVDQIAKELVGQGAAIVPNAGVVAHPVPLTEARFEFHSASRLWPAWLLGHGSQAWQYCRLGVGTSSQAKGVTITSPGHPILKKELSEGGTQELRK